MDAHEPEDLEPGAWVNIEGMIRVGRILAIDVRRRIAEVDVGGITWSIKLNRLRASADAAELGERLARENLPPAVSIPQIESSDAVDLHGLTVEEAIEVLDKFVDSAIVNRLEFIKIIHGHGSGKLRNAVRRYLTNHSGVLRFQFGAPWQGGLAVTLVWLGRNS